MAVSPDIIKIVVKILHKTIKIIKQETLSKEDKV